jgi:hypothetical protein
MLRNAAFKDALVFHAVFFAVALPAALLLKDKALGTTLVVLALGYNIALPLAGFVRGHDRWPRLWLFLVPLSLTLPCADWMLVERMGTLMFPDHGVPRLGGAVPIYFMGLVDHAALDGALVCPAHPLAVSCDHCFIICRFCVLGMGGTPHGALACRWRRADRRVCPLSFDSGSPALPRRALFLASAAK